LLIDEIDLQMREGDHAFRQGEEAYLSAQAWITGAIALAVALSALAGFFIVTSVSRPIRRLTALMARLAGNDLSVAVAGAERRDEVGAMAKAVSVFKESMVERQRLAAELERQARLDPLTGAFNRRAFDELLRRDVARAQRHGRPLAVILIDIDHFKRVNDTMGHAAGDRFLVAVAKTIAAVLRAEDLLCRYGGEEFIVVLPETDGTGALQAAERLRAAIEALRLDHEGVARSITASFGVASFADPARDTIENVIHAADLALYRAKATGRNRVVSYDATQSPKAAAG
jgi:diguanylate cyclase (GGDEF)-like protein